MRMITASEFEAFGTEMLAQTMYMIVYPDTLKEEVIELLDRVGVPGFTETQKVIGRGSRGRHFDTPIWPGADGMIYVLVGPELSVMLAAALTSFCQAVEQRSNGVYGLHVFAWPCRQLF